MVYNFLKKSSIILRYRRVLKATVKRNNWESWNTPDKFIKPSFHWLNYKIKSDLVYLILDDNDNNNILKHFK